MIPISHLKSNYWYDGFIHKRGKQSGTAAMQWKYGGFWPLHSDESYEYHDGISKRTFEPMIEYADGKMPDG